MNRRNFLAFLATGTVVNAVAPSQVWPFRKIFLPAMREFTVLAGKGITVTELGIERDVVFTLIAPPEFDTIEWPVYDRSCFLMSKAAMVQLHEQLEKQFATGERGFYPVLLPIK